MSTSWQAGFCKPELFSGGHLNASDHVMKLGCKITVYFLRIIVRDLFIAR